MTPESFIATWKANTRNEAAASKAHFLDLCALLDVPPPHSDPTGTTYAFEKGVRKASGSGGWADVWKRGCFGWEYKSRGGNLEQAHDQLLRYAGALENPPLLITSDMDRIVVRTNWTNAVSERREFGLEDLRDAKVRALLRACWTDPDSWRPVVTRQSLTEQAAGEFAELARRLRERGHDPQTVAHFINRMVFCLFADDVGLLPDRLLSDLLTFAARKPAEFAAAASELFRAMRDRGGRIGFQAVQWFNGGLFDDDTALPLQAADIALLARISALDWAEVDPSIFGTLFERGLDPDKRSQLGAHYTDRDKIGLLVDAAIVRPLLAAWDSVRARISAAMDERAVLTREAREAGGAGAEALMLADSGGITAASRAAKTALRRAGERRTKKLAELMTEAQALYNGFVDRLRAFRVLDPACGSGNFLYLSLLALKDLELRVGIEAEVFGLEPALPLIGPESVLGIEINPYAAELARVSVWIGHIQWARRNGFPPPSDPVLRTLDTIECRDAVLAPDGSAAAWPAVDAIVGNPPFLGSKWMIDTLGESYTKMLRAAYENSIPATSDLVSYWIEKARRFAEENPNRKVGLVATNMIRGAANRQVMERVVATCSIFESWSDEPWILNGADVRVSLICFCADKQVSCRLDGVTVSRIFADLSAGASDITSAIRLTANLGIAHRGIEVGGPFDVDGDLARRWLCLPENPNGRRNAEILKPVISGRDVATRLRDRWLVDFGNSSENEAACFPEIYGYASRIIRPTKASNRESRTALNWWHHRRSGAELRAAIANLDRFIATILVSKHRFFVWIPAGLVPETRLVIIARDDDTAFGILSSALHSAWTLKSCQYHGVGNDPVYTPSTTFETFPFPEGLTPNIPAADYAANPHAQRIAAAARALVEARDRWLNPADLVDRVPEVVPGFPDRLVPKNAAAAAMLKKRTLTALYNTRGTPEGTWLDTLHRTLDEAVAASYGWPADITTDDALGRLLALNHARAAA